MNFGELSSFRLVGETALALQIGHRNSVDIDLFSFNIDNPDTAVLFSEFQLFEILNQRKRMATYLCDGIKVDMVIYPYHRIDEPVLTDERRMASMKDIAAMKVAAITNRGTLKDFIDLYFLLEYFSFSEILDFYKAKFRDANIWLALRSLSYFGDAELESKPTIFKVFDWEEGKEKIRREIKNYTKSKQSTNPI